MIQKPKLRLLILLIGLPVILLAGTIQVLIVLSGDVVGPQNATRVVSLQHSPSFGASAAYISRTVTAGTGGVTQNLIASKDASNPTLYVLPGAGGCGSGFAATTAIATATFELITVPGSKITAVADGTITAGHILTGGSSTPGRVADTGQTARTAVAAGTCIIGVALASATFGNNVLIGYDGTGIYGAGSAASISFPVTVSGTVMSGGIPYFNSTTQMSSSALLASGYLIYGGGAGNPPSQDQTSAAQLFWDAANNPLLGVGTNSPSTYLDGAHGIEVEASGSSASVTISDFRNGLGGNFTLNHARGSQSSPANLNVSDLVGVVYGQAWTSTLNNFNEIGAQVFEYTGTSGGHDFGNIYWTLHDMESQVLTLGQRQDGVFGSPNRIIAQATFQQAESSTDPICTTSGTDTGAYWVNSSDSNNFLFQTCLREGAVVGWQNNVITSPSGITRLGVLDAAAPVAQTLGVQSVVAGTSNTAGANWKINGSAGTGTGAGGSIIFQTAPAGSTGTAQNAFAAALTIDSTGAVKTANITINASSVQGFAAATGGFQLASAKLEFGKNAGVMWGTNVPTDTVNASLTQIGAGLLGIGIDNTIAGTGGSLRLASIQSGGTKFTTSGCSVSATTGGATAGTLTSGTTGACTVVITMNGATGLTAPNGWSCAASDLTTPANLVSQSAVSATTCTITGTTVSGDVLTFHAFAY